MKDKKILKEFEDELIKSGLSRREAIKLLGLSGGLLFLNNEMNASTTVNASDAKAKIVIVGGGLSGIATAARLSNSLSSPNITIIEPNENSVSYQPGNTFIGAGLYEKKDVMYSTKDFLPKEVTLIKDKAVEFDPQNNKLLISSGKTIKYDFLVIAAGLVLDFTKIKGLEEIGDVYTSEDSKQMNEVLSNTGVSSIYNMDGAVQT